MSAIRPNLPSLGWNGAAFFVVWSETASGHANQLLSAMRLQFGGHAAMRLREEFVAGGEQVARHRCAHDAEADESEFHVSSP